jgi:hypothetical protein
METKTNQDYEIKVGRTEIIVPHKGNKLIHISPAKGPGTYLNVMEEILEDNLSLPTGEYTASLLYAAYCGPEDFKNKAQVSNVRQIMKDDWIWVANKNLWIPKKQSNSGVFVVYDEKGTGLTEQLSQAELEKILEDGEDLIINTTKIRISKDRKVRFASRDTYEGGIQSPEDLAKNGFIIAGYLEQANQLSEVSKTFDNKPKVWILDSKNIEQRVSALYEIDDGLGVFGDDFDDYSRGHVFGVL